MKIALVGIVLPMAALGAETSAPPPPEQVLRTDTHSQQQDVEQAVGGKRQLEKILKKFKELPRHVGGLQPQ